MGKNLIQQARGKGSPTYRAPSFRYKGKTRLNKKSDEDIKGNVKDIIHCAGHNAPLAVVNYENGEEALIQAPESIKVGDDVFAGNNVEMKWGNVTKLRNIPEGTSIYNIEGFPGDGGKFVRSAGTFAKVVSKVRDNVIVLLPSNRTKEFKGECRACIGTIAGSGRKEKPFLKAGRMYYAMKSKNKLWPRISGTSQNAVDHPFGGSSSGIKGRPTQASRNAPPGRKVGKIAPKRTGRRKR